MVLNSDSTLRNECLAPYLALFFFLSINLIFLTQSYQFVQQLSLFFIITITLYCVYKSSYMKRGLSMACEQ